MTASPAPLDPQPHHSHRSPSQPAEPDQADVPTSVHTSHGTGTRPSDYQHCTGSVSGHAQNDRSGLCAWCRFRVDPPVPMPRLGPTYRTELDLAYRQFYDPDWGTSAYDV